MAKWDATESFSAANITVNQCVLLQPPRTSKGSPPGKSIFKFWFSRVQFESGIKGFVMVQRRMEDEWKTVLELLLTYRLQSLKYLSV